MTLTAVRAPSFSEFRSALATHLRSNLPTVIVFGVIGAVSSWAINVYWIARSYEGTNVPDGSPVTAGGNMIWGLVFWTIGSSVVFGILGYWKSVGTQRFFTDVRAFPSTIVQICRDDGAAMWTHLLWGIAGALVLTQVLSPSLSGLLGVSAALTIPTVLGRVILGYVGRLWSATMARFNPGRERRPVPIVAPAVGGFGAAGAMVVAFLIDDTTAELVLAAVAAGAAIVLHQRTRGGSSAGTAALLMLLSGGIVVLVLLGGGRTAVADDGGFAECGSDWSEWWDCEGADRVRRDAGVGGLAGAFGSTVGASVGPAMAAAAQGGGGGYGGSGGGSGGGPDGRGRGDGDGPSSAGDGPPDPDRSGEATESGQTGGSMTAETQNADGTTTRIHVAPDGTQTTTVLGPDGSVISRTVEPPMAPGSMSAETQNADGTTTRIDVAPDGTETTTVYGPDGQEISPTPPDQPGESPDWWGGDDAEGLPTGGDAAPGQQPEADVYDSAEASPRDGEQPAAPGGGETPWWAGSDDEPAQAPPGWSLPGQPATSGGGDEVIGGQTAGAGQRQPDAVDPRAETVEQGRPVDPFGETVEQDRPVDPFGETVEQDRPVDPFGETVEQDRPVDPFGETVEQDRPVDPFGETVEQDRPVDPVLPPEDASRATAASDGMRFTPESGFMPDGRVYDANGRLVGFWDPDSVDADGRTTMVDLHRRPGVPVVDQGGRIIGVAPGPDSGGYTEFDRGGRLGRVETVPSYGSTVGTEMPDGRIVDADGNTIGERVDWVDARGNPRTDYVDRDGNRMTPIGPEGEGRRVAQGEAISNRTPVVGRELPDGTLLDRDGRQIGQRVGFHQPDDGPPVPIYEDMSGQRINVGPERSADPSARSIGAGPSADVPMWDGTTGRSVGGPVPLPEGLEHGARPGLETPVRTEWDRVGAGPNGELYGPSGEVVGRIDSNGRMWTNEPTPREITGTRGGQAGRAPAFIDPDTGAPLGGPSSTPLESTPRGTTISDTPSAELLDRATGESHGGRGQPDLAPVGDGSAPRRAPAPDYLEQGYPQEQAADARSGGTVDPTAPEPAATVEAERPGATPRHGPETVEQERPVDPRAETVDQERPVDPRAETVDQERPVDPRAETVDQERPVDPRAETVDQERPVDPRAETVDAERPVSPADAPTRTGDTSPAVADTAPVDPGRPGTTPGLARLGDAADLAGNVHTNMTQHGMGLGEALGVGASQTAVGNVAAAAAQEAGVGLAQTPSALTNVGGSLAAGSLLPNGLDNLMPERMAANTVLTAYEGAQAAMSDEDGAFVDFVNDVADRPGADPFAGYARAVQELADISEGRHDTAASTTLGDHVAAAEESATEFQQDIAAGGGGAALQGLDHLARGASEAAADWPRATTEIGNAVSEVGADIIDNPLRALDESIDHFQDTSRRGDYGMVSQGWSEIAHEAGRLAEDPAQYASDAMAAGAEMGRGVAEWMGF